MKRTLKKLVSWMLVTVLMFGLMPVPMSAITAQDLSEASQTDATMDETGAEEQKDIIAPEDTISAKVEEKIKNETEDTSSGNGENSVASEGKTSETSVKNSSEESKTSDEKTDKKEEKEEKKDKEEKTEETDEAKDEVEFSDQATVSGVVINVSADKGVFPAGSTMSVRKLSDFEADVTGVTEAVDKKTAKEKNIAKSLNFDITIYDSEGHEIEPDNSKGEVRVSFTSSFVSDVNTDAKVYHVDDSKGTLKAEKLTSVAESGSTIAGNTDGFSVYSLVFEYDKKEYEIRLDESSEAIIPLAEIVSAVGLSGTISGNITYKGNVAGKISIVVTDTGTALKLLNPFYDPFTMILTIDGLKYEILIKGFGTHSHNGIEFEPWTDELAAEQYGDASYTASNSLPKSEGNYYLTEDVTTSFYSLSNGINLNLCLNGKTVVLSDRCMTVSGTLNLYDDEGGTIVNNRTGDDGKDGAIYVYNTLNMYGGTLKDSAYGVFVGGGGTFNMYGGTITNNSSENYAAVYVDGTFNMSGGSITGNNCGYGGVCVYGNANISGGKVTGNSGIAGVFVTSLTSSSMTLTGAPVISGNTKDGAASNILTMKKINVSGLSSGSKYGVRFAKGFSFNRTISPGAFATGYTGTNPNDAFVSEDTRFHVVKKSDGNLWLAHEHEWTYTNPSGDASKLEATCSAESECNLEKQTLALNIPTGLYYDGTPHVATLTKSDDWTTENGLLSVGNIVYTPTSGSLSVDEPVDAGNYMVKVILGDNQNSLTGLLKIEKAPFEATITMSGWKYGEAPVAPQLSKYAGEATPVWEYKLKDASDDTYTEEIPQEAGEYTVRATIADTKNYAGGTATADFEIAKSTNSLDVSIEDWTYGEEAKKPVIDVLYGSKDDVTCTYYTSDDKEVEGVPVSAGKYYVKAVAKKTASYDEEQAIEEFEIKKASLTIKADDKTIKYGDETGETVTCTGFVKDDDISKLSGKLVFETVDSDGKVYTTVSPSGEYTITPSGLTSENYDIKYESGKLTVEKNEKGKAFELILGTGVSGIEVISDTDSVVDGILTDDEKKKVADGADAVVSVTVNAVSTPAGDTALKMNAAAGKDAVIAKYYDFNLFKNVTGQEEEHLHESPETISYKVELPEDMADAGDDVERTIEVVRYHEGEAEVIDSSYSEDDNTVSFGSKEYSIFGIAYIDEAIEEETTTEDVEKKTPKKNVKPDNKETAKDAQVSSPEKKQNADSKNVKTGDEESVTLLLILMILSLVNIVVFMRIKCGRSNEGSGDW